MTSFRIVLERNARYIVAAAALLLATIVPALASAAQVTVRSIALSSSTAGATGVTYQVNFTPVSNAAEFVVDFCSDSPLVGSTCAPPADMDVTGAASTDATSVTGTGHQIVVVKALTGGTPVSVAITGITNPSTVGPLYARIVTYASGGSSSYNSTSTTGDIDEGGVAMSITNNVNVSGAVLESMTFCVSGPQDAAHPTTNPITTNCAGTTTPKLKLGKDVGGVVALDSSDVYTGMIFTQISTNAAGGAVVNLKSSAVNCGGLLRSSDPTKCDIAAAGASGDVAANQAKFGVKLGEDVDDATNGKYQHSGSYDDSHYRMNYVDSSSGVTSTYGDPILNTAGAFANNLDMPLTFGASVTNNTPAGNYSADLSLIATGTF